MFVHGFAISVRNNSKNIKWLRWNVDLRNFVCTCQGNSIYIKIWQTRLKTSCEDLNVTRLNLASTVKYQSEKRRFSFNPMIKILFMWTDYQAVVKQPARKMSCALHPPKNISLQNSNVVELWVPLHACADAMVTKKIEEKKIRDDKIFGVKVCTKLDKYRNQHIGIGSKILRLHNRINDTEDGSGSNTCSKWIITDCRKGNNVKKRWGDILCRKGHHCYTMN
jgi:hypothetical protein